MSKSSVKDQTLSSAKWNGLERVSSQGIQFVLTLILARLLSPTDYGIIGMLAIFIEVSQSFIDSGFQQALVRKKDVNEKDFSTAFYFNVLVSIFFYTVLFFSGPFIADFFHQPILCSVLRVYAITLFLNSLMAVQVSKLQIKLDFKSLAKRNVSATLLSGLIGISFAYFGWGVWALVFQNISHALFNLIFICLICKWIPKEHFSIDSFRYLWSFGSRMMGAGLLNTLYQNMTTIAIGKFYSAQDLGLYTRGRQFSHIPTNTINGVLGTVTYPILSKIQDETERLMAVYKKYIRMSSLAIFFMCVLMAALAHPLILLILTEKWSGSIIYLQIFAFGSMFNHLSTINLNLLKVKGRSDYFFKLEVIKKTISIAILCAAIPLGVLAICISKLLYNQIAIVINTYYTGKLFNYGYVEQWKDFLPYFFKTIIACLPAFALTFTPLPYIMTILLGTVIAVVLYVVILRKDESFKEIIEIMEDKVPATKKITRYLYIK